MNNIFSDMRKQMRPDKQLTEELINKIESNAPQQIRSPIGSKLMFAVPAAACLALCTALILAFSRFDKPETNDQIVSDIDTNNSDLTMQTQDISDSSTQLLSVESADETQGGVYKLELKRCEPEDIIYPVKETVSSDNDEFADENFKKEFFELNKEIEFDGIKYEFVGEYSDNSEELANIGCYIGNGGRDDRSLEWIVSGFSTVSDDKKIALCKCEDLLGDHHFNYYLYENTKIENSAMTLLESYSFDRSYCAAAFDPVASNDELDQAIAILLSELENKKYIEFSSENYIYKGIYDGEFKGIPAPDEYNIDYTVEGYGIMNMRFSSGGHSQIYFSYYRETDDILLLKFIDGTAVKYEKSNTAAVPVPDLKGFTLEEAEAALSDLGLVCAAEDREDEGEAGRVVDQSIAPGEEVPLGSTVTIYISISTEEQQGTYTVNSAVITVSEIYSKGSEFSREEISRIISEEEKFAQLSAVGSFVFDGREYRFCGRSDNSSCINVDLYRPIGKGTINVDGVVTKVWFYSTGEPVEDQIAVDLGDWRGAIFLETENSTPVEQPENNSKISLALKKYDKPTDVRTDVYWEYSDEDKKIIFDELGEITFDGMKYKFNGEVLSGVAQEYIGSGTIEYNGGHNEAYVSTRKGYSQDEEIIIDLGDWKWCVMKRVYN